MRREAPGAPLTDGSRHADAPTGVDALPGAVVELKHVSKRYSDTTGGVDALVDVSLSVRPGEFVAFMGPSGSGKSTLLHLIGAIDRATSGDIVLNGSPLTAMSAREEADYRNREVGFVFQTLNLIPTLTVEENLWLPAAIAGFSRRSLMARIGELLELLCIPDKRTRFPQELSGGEQQRVAIARAMLMKPALILADEPTGSLDLESSQKVMELLLALHRQGQVILLATHDTRVASLADRVIYLRDGRIDEDVSLSMNSSKLAPYVDQLMASSDHPRRDTPK